MELTCMNTAQIIIGAVACYGLGVMIGYFNWGLKPRLKSNKMCGCGKDYQLTDSGKCKQCERE